jgi:hypothetical protein
VRAAHCSAGQRSLGTTHQWQAISGASISERQQSVGQPLGFSSAEDKEVVEKARGAASTRKGGERRARGGRFFPTRGSLRGNANSNKKPSTQSNQTLFARLFYLWKSVWWRRRWVEVEREVSDGRNRRPAGVELSTGVRRVDSTPSGCRALDVGREAMSISVHNFFLWLC